MDSPEPAKPDEVIDLALDAPEPAPVFLDLDEPAAAAGPGMLDPSVPGAPVKPARPPWQWAALGAGGLAVVLAISVGAGVLLSGGDGLEELKAQDPKGAEACAALTYWMSGKSIDPATGKPYNSLVAGSALAELAKDSTTPGIRAAAGDDLMASESGRLLRQYGGPSTFRLLSPEKLHKACTEAGVEMPPYADPKSS